MSSAPSYPLRAAVIGLGYWGPNIARNVSTSPTTELVGVCDANTERLDQVARTYPAARRYSTADDVFKDPGVDAVLIATPLQSHHSLAMAALRAGKHVVLEKPFTSSVAEAEELVQLASVQGRVLMVDHVFLYSPAVQKLASLYREGELGDLLFIDCVRINLGIWQADIDVLWDLAPHDLSIIDHLLQRLPRGVMAMGSRQAGQDLASVAYVHLDYGDNLVASLHVNWLSPVKIRYVMVGGSRRSVVYNDLHGSEPIKVYDRGIDFAVDPEGRRQVLAAHRAGSVVSPAVDRTEALQNMICHFADCVARKAAPLSGGEEALRMLRILDAASASMRLGGAMTRVEV